jgi:hypothetical protein
MNAMTSLSVATYPNLHVNDALQKMPWIMHFAWSRGNGYNFASLEICLVHY